MHRKRGLPRTEMSRRTVDGSQMVDKTSALDAIAVAMEFPEYFGRNLDALYDCLTDLSWLSPGTHVLLWRDSCVLRNSDATAFQTICAVLEDAVRDGENFTYQLL